MPLHDWTDGLGWEGVHHLWISELLRWIKPRLPVGYRAYIGSAPTVEIGAAPKNRMSGCANGPGTESVRGRSGACVHRNGAGREVYGADERAN